MALTSFHLKIYLEDIHGCLNKEIFICSAACCDMHIAGFFFLFLSQPWCQRRFWTSSCCKSATEILSVIPMFSSGIDVLVYSHQTTELSSTVFIKSHLPVYVYGFSFTTNSTLEVWLLEDKPHGNSFSRWFSIGKRQSMKTNLPLE